MSIKLISRVFSDTSIKGNEKLLMLALADNCNDEGVCFPSWNTLIEKTSMSRGSLAKLLTLLESKELILRVKRNRKNGSNTSNKYLIYPKENIDNLDEDDFEFFSDFIEKTSDFTSSENKLGSSEIELGSSEIELACSSEIELLKPSLYNSNFNHKEKINKKEKKDDTLVIEITNQSNKNRGAILNTKITKKQAIINTIELSDTSNINLDSLIEWLEYKNWDYKPIGIAKIIKMLNRHSKEIQKEIIDKSIMNNYKGLFEPRQNIYKTQSEKRLELIREALDDFNNGFRI